MKIAIMQPYFCPYLGYFQLVNAVDKFVFYDDVQFTKNDWRNRNKVKTKNGAEWITIPVGGGTARLINEVEIQEGTWQAKHWKPIQYNYAK